MPKTILLADDSVTIQKVVGIVFATEDYQVTAVDNGEDALRKVREMRPDIVLADAHWGARCRLAYAWSSLLASGAAVGGYFLFKPQSVSPVNGTLAPHSSQLSFGSHGLSFGGRR